MELKHTPGPWKVRYFNQSNPSDGFFVEAPNNNMPQLGYAIEIMQDDFGDHNGYPLGQREADAKLIAAAPDMFEVIKELYDWAIRTDTKGRIFPKLEAAYFKATK